MLFRKTTILLAQGLLLLAGLHAQATGAKSVAAVEGSVPVPVVQDGRFEVATAAGRGEIPIHVSRDWTTPQPDIERAVIVIHGWQRSDLGAGEAAAAAAKAGLDSSTLVVTPQFLIQPDIDAHALSARTLRWSLSGWKSGADATGPAPISSFAVLEAIVARLADRRLFPHLSTVVVAGHSAGGQLVQRYAVLGGADRLARQGVHVRYVVANPSSYLYFDVNRPRPAAVGACPRLDRWPYGFDGEHPAFLDPSLDVATAERHYASLDLIYLLGTADNDPAHHQLDRSCAGEAEGATRIERGLAYAATMHARDGERLTQRVFEVPGVGHHSARMFTSTCGVAALFDRGECAAIPIPVSTTTTVLPSPAASTPQ